jgi:hypothetical protein
LLFAWLEAKTIGRGLIYAGLGLIVAGVLVLVLERFVRLGELPLDVRVERERWSFYFPLGTMLLLSLLATLILNLIFRR